VTAINDTVGAFMDYEHVEVPHAADGPLAGLTLAVKDIFDVAGYPTGCGNPTKLAEAKPATTTARSVQTLLDAGARCVGKTITDELAFSLFGQNIHYGAPVNSRAPDRVTGGSSCGSVAAVAAGLVDIATGSDTGGSIRAPASFCGLVGLRPTWGRLPLDGTMPLASSLDTFGWFARDMATYKKVAAVLMSHYEEPGIPLARPMLATDAFALLLGEREREALAPALGKVEVALGAPSPVIVAEDGLEDWFWVFRRIQAYEAWQAHGAWIEASKPQLGPGVVDRFFYGRDIGVDTYAADRKTRVSIQRRMESLMGEDGVLVLPTVPSIAPLKKTDHESLDIFRNRALQILCISGLSCLPQITLPLAEMDGAPLGLSLIAPAGRDRALIQLADRIMGD